MIIYKNGILAQEGVLQIGEYRTIRTIPHKFGVDASAIRMQITPDGRRSLSILDDVMGKMQNNNPGLSQGGVSVRWGYSVFGVCLPVDAVPACAGSVGALRAGCVVLLVPFRGFGFSPSPPWLALHNIRQKIKS